MSNNPRDDAPANRSSRTDAVLGLIAQCGIAIFVGDLLLLHRLRPDLDPSRRYISEYALGQYGSLMTLALLGLSAASGTLALALGRGKIMEPRARLGVVLLGIHSLGTLLAAVFPTDLSIPGSRITWVGRVHEESGQVAIDAVVLAMALISYTFRHDPRWRSLHLPGFLLTVLAALAYLWLRYAQAQGWPQRSLFAVVVLWLGMVAGRLGVIAWRR